MFADRQIYDMEAVYMCLDFGNPNIAEAPKAKSAVDEAAEIMQ